MSPAKKKNQPKKPGPPAPRREKPSSDGYITCLHCRYVRPVKDARCHICGYPWPWLKE